MGIKTVIFYKYSKHFNMISARKMILMFVVLCSLGKFTVSAPQEKVMYNIEDVDNLFEEFIRNYNKQYATPEEKDRRRQAFIENLEKINRKNADEKETASFAINHFSDLTSEEFKAINLNYLPSDQSPCQPMIRNYSGILLPKNLDWREKNAVTAVKQQRNCGACWAFASVANIESIHAKTNGELLDLSEQQVLDCTKDEYDCRIGGNAAQAMIKVIERGGIMDEADYPYEDRKGECRFNSGQVKAKVTSCTKFIFQSENDIKEALYENGPIAIGVSGDALHQYHGGVFKECSGSVNHAVLLIGYGESPDGPFWLIKNSWGPEWGENGFARLAMGQNICNMMQGEFSSVVI